MKNEVQVVEVEAERKPSRWRDLVSGRTAGAALAASAAGGATVIGTGQASAAPIGDYTGITSKFTEEFGAALVVGLGIFGTIAAVVVAIRVIKRMMS